MKRFLFFGVLLLTIASCATEKPNFSPLSTSFYSETKASDSDKEAKNSIDINVKGNVNASEISNLIATFPQFKNTALNNEIAALKYSLQNYLYAIDADNLNGKNKAIKDFEKSYKKVQKLRVNLNKDDNEVLNRYLVRLKTNVSAIEDYIKGN
ncbi:hypothetical protein SAMN05421856_10483 [Chryseobacterium taichungense]|uniref:Uncharacterized protein n=1 Tax=Chryseobacterium taichungense TaxID=295069 RepID=A0A1H7Z7J5_9FLAO|nr:hypothetical protein [Chryseobacterium taichungense]SEM54201.1 hypothetical protein SAMN05421856_10483 [Chryseobacterium taichungense]